MSWLRILWSKLRGFWATPAGRVVEQAASEALRIIGQALLDYLMSRATAKARELEAKFGPRTGPQKAAALDSYLTRLIEEAGREAVPRIVNWVREQAVMALGNTSGEA